MELNWDKIYVYWNFRCNRLNSNITEGIKFREIKIARTKSKDRIDTRVWWPNNAVEERIEKINDSGIMNESWEQLIGRKRSAELFWEFKADKEKTALIWIAASLLEVRRNFPAGWREDTYNLIKEVQAIIVEEMRSKNMWWWNNNTINMLPNGLVKNTDFVKAPGDVHELMEIIAVENVLSFSTWTLVSVTSN